LTSTRLVTTFRRRAVVQIKELKTAGYVNLGLASWALCSAYIWRHDRAQFLITALVGSAARRASGRS